MPILNATEQHYTFKPEEIQALIANDLGVEIEKVSVRYVIEEVDGDPMDRYPGRNEVTRIEVTITW